MTVVAVRPLVAGLMGAGLMGAGLAGCALVEQPDAAGWDHEAELALTGAASEVATARLALEAAAQERTWSSYTTVVVAQAEEAVATVAGDLARLQVPSARRQRAEDVAALVDEAVTAVEDARSLAVEGRYDGAATAEQLDHLGSLADELERAAVTGR